MNMLLFLLGVSACTFPFAAGAADGGQPDTSSTRTIRVAAVQLRGELGGIVVNQAKAERLIREAAAKDAKYVLLPEVPALFPESINPETIDEVFKEAQPVPGLLTDQMTSLSRELDVNIAFGMAEKVGTRMRNSAVFVDPSGIVGVYSKRALVTHESVRAWAEKNTGKRVPPLTGAEPPDEATLFEKGDKDGLFMWGGVKTGVLICADGGAESFWQYLADNGAQLLCWPSANSGGPLLPPPLPEDVARKYHLPLIFANHLPKQVLHIGNSQVIDAEGKAVAKGKESEPDIMVVGDVKIRPVGGNELRKLGGNK